MNQGESQRVSERKRKSVNDERLREVVLFNVLFHCGRVLDGEEERLHCKKDPVNCKLL